MVINLCWGVLNQNWSVPIPLHTSLRDSYILIHWPDNRMTDWLTDWLIDRTNDCFLAGWLSEWINDWLAGWLNELALKTVYTKTTWKKVGAGIYFRNLFWHKETKTRNSFWHKETKTRNQTLKKGEKEKENVRLTDYTEASCPHVWL